MYIPENVTQAQLTRVLRGVPVTVHNPDGTTTTSNLFDQASNVYNGTVQVHVTGRGTQLGTPAQAQAAPTAAASVETDDDGTVTVSATFSFRGL